MANRQGNSILAVLVLAVLAASGCTSVNIRDYPFPHAPVDASDQVARELDMVSMPEYRVEPPDILIIQSARVVPKEPYIIKEFDILGVFVTGTSQPGEIAGDQQVSNDGTIPLSVDYGRVKVAGLTFREAEAEIRQHLSQYFGDNVEVAITLTQSLAIQPIQDNFVVEPDGTVNLGVYGRVRVVGMTIAEMKEAIEKHLSQYLESPELSITVAAYNSKVYYVIFEGAGQGDRIIPLPVTGSDTVLSSISRANNGLLPTSGKRIWVARPTPGETGYSQRLPVDWQAITAGGSAETNYQIWPGDRIVVAEDKVLALTTTIDKMLRPFERMFSTTLLGTQTIQQANRFPSGIRQ